MTQATMSSVKSLTTYFPINFASRVMAYDLYNGVMEDEVKTNNLGVDGNMICQSMVGMAVADTT